MTHYNLFCTPVSLEKRLIKFRSLHLNPLHHGWITAACHPALCLRVGSTTGSPNDPLALQFPSAGKFECLEIAAQCMASCANSSYRPKQLELDRSIADDRCFDWMIRSNRRWLSYYTASYRLNSERRNYLFDHFNARLVRYQCRAVDCLVRNRSVSGSGCGILRYQNPEREHDHQLHVIIDSREKRESRRANGSTSFMQSSISRAGSEVLQQGQVWWNLVVDFIYRVKKNL